jgi:hypothetical protein
MATRSRIGYVNENGQIVSAYCHYDGYPKHNGKILKKHYTTLDKVKQLVNRGDMSCLGDVCEKPEGHSFATPSPRVTVYYGRDRGEKNVNAKISATKKDLVKLAEGSWGEYVYLFENGKWAYCDVSDGNFSKLGA